MPAGAIAAVFYGFNSQNGTIPPNMVSGAGTFVFAHHGTLPHAFPFLTDPGFTGTEVNNPLGEIGGAGPSAFRPAPAIFGIRTACAYFDTSLGVPLPVFWDGAGFVSAAGLPA